MRLGGRWFLFFDEDEFWWQGLVIESPGTVEISTELIHEVAIGTNLIHEVAASVAMLHKVTASIETL